MRISRDVMFMEMAHAAAKRSTCFRGNIGAVLVQANKFVIGIGYNGPPSGDDHCHGQTCAVKGQGCHRALHAEENVLEHANFIRDPDLGNDGGKLTLYCTASPCANCAQKIIDHKLWVGRIVFANPYRLLDGVTMLIRDGHDVQKLLPAGQLIDMATEQLIDAK